MGESIDGVIIFYPVFLYISPPLYVVFAFAFLSLCPFASFSILVSIYIFDFSYRFFLSSLYLFRGLGIFLEYMGGSLGQEGQCAGSCDG
jgi:hypothetical protein